MSRKDDILNKVRAIAEPLAEGEGLELVDVELATEFGGTVLRFYIDRLPGRPPPKARPAPPGEEAVVAVLEGAAAAGGHEDEGAGEEGEGAEADDADAGDLAALDDGGDVHEDAAFEQITAPGTGKGTGVTLDDCTNFSRVVSASLDVEDPIDGAYDLQVSSPGLDRPLRKPEHFVKYAGQKVRVRTYAPIPEAGARKNFVGTLLGMAGDKVRVDVDGTVYDVPLAQVSKANIEPVFEF